MPTRFRHMNSRTRTAFAAILFGGATGILIYAYLHFSESGFFPSSENLSGFTASLIAGILIGVSVYFLNHFLDRFYPWKGGFAGRFFTGFIGYLLLSVGATSLMTWGLVESNLGNVLWTGFSSSDDDVLWKLFILLSVGSFIYSIVYALLYSYKQYAVTQIEILQHERKQLELQFEALKSQLSPHYLFNSLNTISSLIYSDPQTAEQFIRRLAQTYQYILSTQNKKYVSLQEELDFVQSYYYLLRIRFQQLLNVDINVPKSIIHTPIPPLTLQLLVENAVKHNTISKEKPLSIYISSIDNTQLKIANTKTQAIDDAPSFQIGLENIKKRYAYFSQKKIEVRNDEKFTVLLPILRMQELPRTPALAV